MSVARTHRAQWGLRVLDRASKHAGMNTNKRAVHVATITRHHKGKTYVTHLLRHSYREDGKVKHLTVGNLSDLPDDLIDVIPWAIASSPSPAAAIPPAKPAPSPA